MKLNILDFSKNKVEQIDLPSHFEEDVRPDLIKRSVLSMQSKKRQPYGSKPEAGKRSSAEVSRRRHKYRGSYGIGISRVPRKIFSRSGTRMNWQGAFAPGTVGGRRAHHPKATKIFAKKINKKERKKALRSAIAASINKEFVKERGHLIPEDYPFILDMKFESLDKTKSIEDALNKLGFEDELKRVKEKKIRAGKGKLRGRKYKTKKGPLIIVSKEDKIMKAAKNIQGVEVIEVKKLNIELLAPGTVPGRVSLWTKEAVEKLRKDNMFL
jgi:large subunit ribosomal protein L4e